MAFVLNIDRGPEGRESRVYKVHRIDEPARVVVKPAASLKTTRRAR
jgi:hypothetical protein